MIGDNYSSPSCCLNWKCYRAASPLSQHFFVAVHRHSQSRAGAGPARGGRRDAEQVGGGGRYGAAAATGRRGGSEWAGGAAVAVASPCRATHRRSASAARPEPQPRPAPRSAQPAGPCITASSAAVSAPDGFERGAVVPARSAAAAGPGGSSVAAPVRSGGRIWIWNRVPCHEKWL